MVRDKHQSLNCIWRTHKTHVIFINLTLLARVKARKVENYVDDRHFQSICRIYTERYYMRDQLFSFLGICLRRADSPYCARIDPDMEMLRNWWWIGVSRRPGTVDGLIIFFVLYYFLRFIENRKNKRAAREKLYNRCV